MRLGDRLQIDPEVLALLGRPRSELAALTLDAFAELVFETAAGLSTTRRFR